MPAASLCDAASHLSWLATSPENTSMQPSRDLADKSYPSNTQISEASSISTLARVDARSILG